MQPRRPTRSAHRTLFPALVTVLAACNRGAPPPEAPGNPPPPPPPPPPPTSADSGVEPRPQVEIIPPGPIQIPLAGAPVPVSPMPPQRTRNPPMPRLAPPAPAPSSMGAPSAPAAAPAPAAPEADSAPGHPLLAGRAPGLYLVHDHPPGTACRPVSQTEIDAIRARLGQR